MPKDAAIESATTVESAPSKARFGRSPAEWRENLAHLGERLLTLSRHGVEEVGDDVAGFSRDMAREGREIVHDLRRQILRVERAAAHSTHDHPRLWITGLIGAIAGGILVGLWLRDPR